MLLKDHAREGYGRAGFGGERLAVLEIPAAITAQQLNQRIKRGKAADSSLVLIFRDFLEKSRPVQQRKTFDEPTIFLFNPFEKIRREWRGIAELPSHMG